MKLIFEVPKLEHLRYRLHIIVMVAIGLIELFHMMLHVQNNKTVAILVNNLHRNVYGPN